MTPVEIGLLICVIFSTLVSFRSFLVYILYKRNKQLQESDSEHGIIRKFTWGRHTFYTVVFIVLFILALL